MLIKNKIIFITACLLNLFLFSLNIHAEEFDISALEISVDKQNNIVTGKGDVVATDSEGRTIKANKIIYEKSREFLLAEGSIEITDIEGNILKTEKTTYDTINEIITTYNNSELLLNDGYKLISSKVLYNTKTKIISSNHDSAFTDTDGNIVEVEMFQYQIEKNLFSSVGKIKIVDINNNKYHFKELHVDTKKREMIGTDVSVLLDPERFGVSTESDPRFVANDIFISKDKSILSKGVFTPCKQRNGRCPPWKLQAKKISHDKAKKNIYYEHATLKVYDIPIFYFPKFYHPDPTVKRQSGFLTPFFTTSTSLGAGFGLPYYWAISNDKDLTFTPKTYTKENILFLNEYRQAFKNGFLTLDTSFTQGYNETSATKTDGSRNHIFAQLDLNLAKDQSYQSDLSFTLQRTPNDTFFRIHDINTALVNAENTNLKNEINYKYSKDNMYLNVSASTFEDLRESSNSRYEYIFPNILFGKYFFSEKFGSLELKSNTFYKNYDVNKFQTFLTNDIIWNPKSYITKKGLVNTFAGTIKNNNYETKNTTDYKNNRIINELTAAISFKSGLLMKKEGTKFSNIFIPNFMIRFAPGHMKDLSTDDIMLNYANLYSHDKTSVIESGLSSVIGFDFLVNKKNKDGSEKEKLSISMGQVFNAEKNEDMPAKSSMDQIMSDVVGEINYNFSKIGNIAYKFSLDHNFNDLNYNEVSTSLNFGKVGFNLDYLEEGNHIGNEHYVSAGVDLNFNDNNKLSFGTKKNYKTNSTELYDISYQYQLDCLAAGLVYRREFYEDSDVQQKNTLMFTIRFVPLTRINAPFVLQ